MNPEAKSGRAENEHRDKASRFVRARALVLWENDLRHMNIGGFFPLVVVMLRGGGTDTYIELCAARHIMARSIWRAISTLLSTLTPTLSPWLQWNFLWVWLVPSFQPPWVCGWSLLLRGLVGKEGKTHRAHGRGEAV